MGGLVIAGTGHRPNKLPMGYHQVSMAVMKRTVRLMLPVNTDHIITGMALGWDTALALVAIEDRIPFTAAVPFKGQEMRWREADQARYRKILRTAKEVHIVCPGAYSGTKMQTRNEWMVDRAQAILALWDGSEGGTGNCVRYARAKNVRVLNCWETFDRISGLWGDSLPEEWQLI